MSILNSYRIVAICLFAIFSHVLNASAILSDDFNPNTTEKNPSWRFYDPYDTTINTDRGESTLTYSGTNAIISIPDGLAHDLWDSKEKNTAPRLLQTISNTDFQFEVKFETEPTVKYQLQGIVIQQSDDILLRFDVFYDGETTQLFIAYIDSATNKTTVFESKSLSSSPGFRQVLRSGDNWTFRYSSDGKSWNDVTFNQSLTVSEVGVFAGTAGVNPSFISSLDYFINLDSPITDNDTWEEIPIDTPPPEIDIWYDYSASSNQSGFSGLTQKWFNVLGNVKTGAYISKLSYRVNGGGEQSLVFGPDKRRLEKTNDFNIEIDRNDLQVGQNSIEIIVKDSLGQEVRKSIDLDNQPNKTWPFPYTAQWGSITKVENIERVGHVVDGLWTLSDEGVRTLQTGYDRSIAIGDANWSSDYEVTVPITIHSDFSGIGFGVGWQGHEGNKSPRIEWPLQALAWIRGSVKDPSLEIITYGGLPSSTWEVVQASKPVSITQGSTYMLKSSSTSLVGGVSQFQVKLWPQGTVEPDSWDINAEVPTRKGSVLLLAYNGDVTFGNAEIQSVPELKDITPPILSNLLITDITDTSATISWETNEETVSTINYGVTDSYGLKAHDDAWSKTHSISITDLNPDTEYYFQVESADHSSNQSTSDQQKFLTRSTPPDKKLSEISKVLIFASNNLVTVSWQTEQPSTSRVEYGTNENYGFQVEELSLKTEHTLYIPVSNVYKNTDYFYKLTSVDENGNVATSLGVYKLLANTGAECFFNWAEQEYANLFSPSLVDSQTYENYVYRYYSATNVYLGIFNGERVHMLEANKSNQIVDVGLVEDNYKSAGCLLP